MLGFSYGETGRSIGVREATVATRVFRARQLLLDRLAGEETPAPEQAARIRPREPALGAGIEARAA